MRLMQIQSKADTSLLRRAGFSLVEMLAVLLILSILITVLVTQLTGQGEVVKARMTESFMTGELGTAITTYETEFGGYPTARFLKDWGTEPNATNLGSEALILSLFRKEWGGADISTDRFVNTDYDSLRKPIGNTDILGKDLMELGDEWGNPIAYFDRKSYGQKHIYLTLNNDTGEEVENTVEARKDGDRYINPRKYQLISAGEDGIFNTEDDLVNWRKQL